MVCLGKKKEKVDGAARQGGGKQKYKSWENRKQKNEEPTRHRGGRGRMKDRSMYNRLMKQSEKDKERKEWNSSSNNSQETEEQKRRHTKGIEDKLSRGQRGTGRDGGSPKNKKNVRLNSSLKRGEN